jgi:hypothetical protein
MLPVDRRQFHVFLSHSSQDKALIVDALYQWMTDIAGLRVWYDSDGLSAGNLVGESLDAAIGECRALVVLLSKASLESKWVRHEIDTAHRQQRDFPDFRIIPILLDDSPLPADMSETLALRFPDAHFTLDGAERLLKAIFTYSPAMQAAVQHGRVRDIFVSRTWRNDESAFADQIGAAFIARGYRLIGDAKDQRKDDPQRIETIMSSCGGVLAILPVRENQPNNTSPFMLDEIARAAALNLPLVIITEHGVTVPDALARAALRCTAAAPGDVAVVAQSAAALLDSEWQPPVTPHYVFYATDFDPSRRTRNAYIRRLIERTTAMQCVMGDAVEEAGALSAQKVITDRIRGAFLVVADVTADNGDTLIQAGIARGAGVDTLLVSADARHDLLFMFGDQRVFHYADDLELYGRLNKLMLPYRRRVIGSL